MPCPLRILSVAVLAVAVALAHGGESGLPARPATTPYLAMPEAPPVPNGAFTAAVAFPNLTFQGAVAVRAVPGTNRLWVLEREGRIWSFEDDPSATTKTLVLDLNDDDLDTDDATPQAGHLTDGTRWWCQGWDDSGLMGLAFHPEFADPGSPNRGRFFICYQARNQPPAIGSAPVFRPDHVSWSNDIPGCFNRLSRFTVPAGTLQADPASELILVDQPDRHLWHNGGDLLFGNDGFLYLLNGDEGRADDYYARTQRVGGAFFGGVWRIDVDGPRPGISKAITHHPRKRNPADDAEPAPFTGNYGIPLDNPWVGLDGVLEEFWCIGLRSPHRMTIDPPSGRIFVGDIGQGMREEVDLIVKGGNYQWAYKEGHKNNRSDRQPPDYTVAVGVASGEDVIAVQNSATLSGNGLSPGQIAVGDRVRFTNHVGFYTVTAVSGYPHTALTITPALVSAVTVGTTVRRTTGFSVVSVDGSNTGSSAPNDYGSSQLTISGNGTLPLGSVIAFPGLGGSHQVIATSGTPDTTTITIRPGFASSPSVTPPLAGTALDRLTVFGEEQPPFMDFNRGGTYAFNAIIGGYVYRGSEHPALNGRYLLANNSSGRIFAIDPDASPATIELLFTMPTYDGGANGYRGLGGFGIDHDGEPLLCVMQAPGQPTNTSTGRLWKIIRSSSTVIGAPIPTELKDTGAFITDGDGTLTSLTPSPSLIPYGVNSPLWSDAAHKDRWIAVPDGSTIDFTTTGAWSFPAGTVFVKHFELTINEQTAERRRLETRLLMRSPGNGVYGVTYKWNAAGTQATLVGEGGVNETYTITESDGVSTRQQTWNYPSRNDCLSCHNSNAGHVLGVNTRQLNGAHTYTATGITANQLSTWSTIGLFSTPPDVADIPSLPALVHVADSGATIERRVRSWLDANCSHCHRPGGVHAPFDARYDTPLRQQGLIEQAAMIPLDVADARIIARGDLTRSLLHQRDSSLDAGIKMPPLAKNLVDTQAMAALETWIASLPYDPQLALGDLAQTYDGTPRSASVSAITDGVPAPVVQYTPSGGGTPSATPPTAAGSYAVNASISNDLLYQGSASGTLVIAKATASVALSDLVHLYDGTPKGPVVSTTPAGLTVAITYDGASGAPSAAGSYDVVVTIVDDNYEGSASSELLISPAPATVSLSRLTQTVDGSPKPVQVTTVPAGLATTVTYNGSATVPSALGSYAVVATVDDSNYSGSASDTLTITAEPTLYLAPPVRSEGDSGSSDAGVNAQLSVASTNTITVDWTISAGTATAGTDFTVVSGTLTFAPGETGKVILVPIIGDTRVEPDETVIVTLSNPVGVQLHAMMVVMTIFNDDTSGGSGGGGSGGGGGGCGLGGGISGLLALLLVVLRRNRLR